MWGKLIEWTSVVSATCDAVVYAKMALPACVTTAKQGEVYAYELARERRFIYLTLIVVGRGTPRIRPVQRLPRPFCGHGLQSGSFSLHSYHGRHSADCIRQFIPVSKDFQGQHRNSCHSFGPSVAMDR